MAPGWQRVAARVTNRRRQRQNGLPATCTDRTAAWMIQQLGARGAGRREDDAEDGVGDLAQGRMHHSIPYRFRFSQSAFRLMPRSRAASVWLPRDSRSVAAM